MGDKEKQAAMNIANAMTELPEAKREYLMGFADAMALMKPRQAAEEKEEA